MKPYLRPGYTTWIKGVRTQVPATLVEFEHKRMETKIRPETKRKRK